MFSGCCKNDKRKHGQKVWFILACSSWRRLWLWAHTRSQKSSLHVFWRDCGSLYLEVLLNRKRHLLMHYSCTCITFLTHLYHGKYTGQCWRSSTSTIIITVDKIFSTIFILSMRFQSYKLAVHCVIKCQSQWLDLKSQGFPRWTASLGLCTFLL